MDSLPEVVAYFEELGVSVEELIGQEVEVMPLISRRQWQRLAVGDCVWCTESERSKATFLGVGQDVSGGRDDGQWVAYVRSGVVVQAVSPGRLKLVPR
jgi:hypothetical protein